MNLCVQVEQANFSHDFFSCVSALAQGYVKLLKELFFLHDVVRAVLQLGKELSCLFFNVDFIVVVYVCFQVGRQGLVSVLASVCSLVEGHHLVHSHLLALFTLVFSVDLAEDLGTKAAVQDINYFHLTTFTALLASVFIKTLLLIQGTLLIHFDLLDHRRGLLFEFLHYVGVPDVVFVHLQIDYVLVPPADIVTDQVCIIRPMHQLVPFQSLDQLKRIEIVRIRSHMNLLGVVERRTQQRVVIRHQRYGLHGATDTKAARHALARWTRSQSSVALKS